MHSFFGLAGDVYGFHVGLKNAAFWVGLVGDVSVLFQALTVK